MTEIQSAARSATPPPPENEEQVANREISFLTICISVFASFFGVQKNKNRIRDFESGKFWHFFVAGLLFVAIFMLSVWAAVQYVLATTPTG